MGRYSNLLILSCFGVLTVAGDRLDAAEPHWSLRPRRRPPVPRFTDPAHGQWVRNPVDAFILHKLLKAGLLPAPEADRQTLIRRLTFDLTGLPPTPEAIAAFLQDPAADAYERLVDRLLVSPHHGERWARHWLDVVRFAETEGFEYDRHRPGAWRYRDYVIQSFNSDLPFDRFLLEQLAGDEIDPSGHELLIAAGFHRLGPVRRNAGNQNVASSRNEVLTEMTDAVSTAFLGLTVGCARCHDHKFDPIPQSDYYHLQAFFAAAQEHDLVLADAKTQAEWTAHAEKVKKAIKKLQEELKTLQGEARLPAQTKIAELQKRLRPALPAISTMRNVPANRTTIHVLKRGDPDRPGPKVAPRVLSVFLPADAPELPSDAGRPRTALARWLNEPDNPLTARVLVNRIWHYHFGKGIVATPNDFGANGASPSHPELLDYLADEFIAGGRRIKSIHRMILLSSVYRQASAERGARSLDPDNRLLGRFPRLRLDAEEVRDAMLTVSGRLNRKAGGPSVIVPAEADLVNLLYDPSQWTVTPDREEHNRRSIYLIAKRNLRLPFSQVFDQPDAQTSCPRRESSTHALQALELLNGKLSNRLAEAFAERLVRECGPDRARQVTRAYQLVAGRAPAKEELAVALEFLKSQPLKEFALALFNLNAFLYVS
jgi:Protein of unknown function (DUF1549)/Protein of unknown function (DUF1553)